MICGLPGAHIKKIEVSLKIQCASLGFSYLHITRSTLGMWQSQSVTPIEQSVLIVQVSFKGEEIGGKPKASWQNTLTELIPSTAVHQQPSPLQYGSISDDRITGQYNTNTTQMDSKMTLQISQRRSIPWSLRKGQKSLAVKSLTMTKGEWCE